MGFIKYDLILLALFALFIGLFLYKKRKEIKREGLLFLYRTQWGVKLIRKVGRKYKKTLKFLSYISITLGYALMIGMLYLFGKLVYLYVAYPKIVNAVKVPPIMPLIPYIDKISPNIGLPPFYFIYFIIILAIVAILHEFSHGIFMSRYKIKIKSTGFGFFPFFLPVFLAAFVEQDEKSMNKAKIFEQKAVLSAGTFANLLTAIVSLGLMVAFFALAFSPSGVQFDRYAFGQTNLKNIESIGNITLNNPTYETLLNLTGNNLQVLRTSDGDFLINKKFLEIQKNNYGIVFAYYDSPAIESDMKGTILKIENESINDLSDLETNLERHSPGEKVNVETSEGNYEIVLGENPSNKSRSWLGVGFTESKRSLLTIFDFFRKSHVYYKEKFHGASFIYNFLWWLVLISFSVALVNMLPMGIFDGGRFFYLTILGFTGSKKKAERWFKGITNFLLFLVLVLMVFWAIGFI